MISHDLQLIFIHIPKCAGTSVEHFLGHFNKYYGAGAQDHRTIRMLQQPWIGLDVIRNKSNIREAIARIKWNYFHISGNPLNRENVTREQFEKYQKITIIRNPWARLHSWYQNVLRVPNHLASYGVTADISFKDFLYQFSHRWALRSQLEWLLDFSGTIKLDYIGRFEQLEDSINKICSLTGKNPSDFPHLLNENLVDYRSAYDSDLYHHVEKSYQAEIKMFGYKFDN